MINPINRRYRETSSEGMKRYYESFMTSRTCLRCNGKDLGMKCLPLPSAENIHDITSMPVSESSEFFSKITLSEREN